jgi:hypothetical protein
MSANPFIERIAFGVINTIHPPPSPMSPEGLQKQIAELKALLATIGSSNPALASSSAVPDRIALRNASADSEFRNVVVRGHLKGSGATPTATLGNATGAGSTINIDGSDIAGVITLTTGMSIPEPGGTAKYPGALVCTVSLADPASFTTSPRVIVVLQSSTFHGYPAGPLTFIYPPVTFSGATTTMPARASFSIRLNADNVSLSPSATYRWNYMVME